MFSVFGKSPFGKSAEPCRYSGRGGSLKKRPGYDEGTLRKAGSRTDPYSVFRGMLESGDPPGTIEELLRAELEIKG